jgi:TolB-like protein/tetratricopeptide (TPR) repeat protein
VLFLFDNYSLDTDRRELRCGAELRSPEPQVFDLLEYLIRNRDRVVSKDDLLAAIWNGRIVSESTLSTRINAARSAIGDNGEDQRLIRTILRKGVRFVGNVREQQSALAVLDGIRHEPALPDKPSIAVLPFQNMSSDPEQEYFADGMAEDIITAMSKLRWFFVIARNSTFAYKGKTPDIRQVARDLGVRYVLEGSVRKAGERLRITAQLCDAVTGNHIWAERYDRDVKDVFAVQDEIVESIVASIEPQLYATENVRIQSNPPESLDAWGCVTRALWHLGRFAPDDNESARQILDRAIALSSSYAKAHSLLAFAQVRRVWFGTGSIEECVPIARDHVRTALLLDESDPWAFFADALVKCLERKLTESVAAFRAAIALNGNFAMAHGYMALPLALCGETDMALSAVQRAMRISPHDPFNVTYLHFAAISYFTTEQYRQSIEFDRRALQERPIFVIALRFIAASHAMLDELDDARAAITELLRMQPNCSIRYLKSLPLYARTSDQDRFMGALRKAGLPEE